MSTLNRAQPAEKQHQSTMTDFFDDFVRFFNIHLSLDPHGDQSWAIELENSHATSNKIYFDLETKRWWKEQPAPHHQSNTLTQSSSPRRHYRRSSSQPSIHDPSSSILQSDYWAEFLPPTEHADMFRSTNWVVSPVGPLSSWPLSLRCYVHQLFADERASIIYWGPCRVAMYNAHAIPLLGFTHPTFMGAAFQSVWPEMWGQFEQIFKVMELTGTGMTITDYNLFLDRKDCLEETYWTGNLTPLRDDSGAVGGFYCGWTEKTREVILDRRTKLIDDLGRTSDIPGISLWEHFCQVFSTQQREINMAVVFSAKQDTVSGDCFLYCEGTIGISGDHHLTSSVLNLDRDKHGWAPILREAYDNNSDWMLLHNSRYNYPSDLLSDIEWQAFGEASSSVVVIPLMVMNRALEGFIVLGLNPRRPFDMDTRSFVSEMSRQLTAVVGSAVTQEQAREREAQLTRHLAESELRIKHMAQVCPIGMYEMATDEKRSFKWANPQFFEILGSVIQTEYQNFPLSEFVHDDDLALVQQQYRECIEHYCHLSFAFRLKRTWIPPVSEGLNDNKEATAWVLNQAYPNVKDGQVVSIIGCLTDISQFKFAETIQARSAQRLESFIDMTSHEIRNPLSAITQCAEAIAMSVVGLSPLQSVESLTKSLLTNAEAAESILLCTMHQKRIIDDVLTLSKLDSQLLHITPAPIQLSTITSDLQLMFKAELHSNDVSFALEMDNSRYSGLPRAVSVDSSRLMQVLINFVSNAIKFTRTESERSVVIRHGLSNVRPDEADFGSAFRWQPSHKPRRLQFDHAADDTQENVYAFFSVQDTGCGLSQHKVRDIFDKASEASRRTHVNYGGSGLGLFISRELVEMQGGLVGVASQERVGSTFAFYIQVKLTDERLPSLQSSLGSLNLSGLSPASSPALSTPPTEASGSPSLDSCYAENGLHSPPIAFTPIATPLGETAINIGLEVLLVEDNIVNQMVLAKQLRKAGYKVHVANHGGEAIDILLQMNGQPVEYDTQIQKLPSSLDCILMDIEMPVCDGLSATKRIRELEHVSQLKNKKQPIIGITANVRSEQIAVALDSGMDSVLPKPFRIMELISKMKELFVTTSQPLEGCMWAK